MCEKVPTIGVGKLESLLVEIILISSCGKLTLTNPGEILVLPLFETEATSFVVSRPLLSSRLANAVCRQFAGFRFKP